MSDEVVRESYRTSVLGAGYKLKKRLTEGTITVERAMEEAVETRNIHLDMMRDKTSPIGLIMARLWKPSARPLKYYQESTRGDFFPLIIKM